MGALVALGQPGDPALCMYMTPVIGDPAPADNPPVRTSCGHQPVAWVPPGGVSSAARQDQLTVRVQWVRGPRPLLRAERTGRMGEATPDQKVSAALTQRW